MQNQKKEILFDALKKLAMLKGDDVQQERIVGYCEYLEKYDTQKVLLALKSLLETHPRFPDISHILKIVAPKMSELDDANEMAGLIFKCITTHGYNNLERARKEIGAEGWWLVERFGGWEQICKVENVETFRAQIRDLAKTVPKIKVRPAADELTHQKSGSSQLGELMDSFKNENNLKEIE